MEGSLAFGDRGTSSTENLLVWRVRREMTELQCLLYTNGFQLPIGMCPIARPSRYPQKEVE